MSNVSAANSGVALSSLSSMCVYVYIYVCMCIYVCVCVCVHACVCMYVSEKKEKGKERISLLLTLSHLLKIRITLSGHASGEKACPMYSINLTSEPKMLDDPIDPLRLKEVQDQDPLKVM